MIKNSEAFDSVRNEYIEGYEEKNKLIFPTLALVAKEFNVSFSFLSVNYQLFFSRAEINCSFIFSLDFFDI